MKPIQMRIVLLVMLLGGAGILLAAAASIQPTLAQVPTVTPLLSSGTVTPILIGRTSVITPKFTLPTRRPFPTRYAGPTITPSGPQVALDSNNLANRFAALPSKIGTFRVITWQQNFDSLSLEFVLENSDGASYRTTIFFASRAQSAYLTYLSTVERMAGGQSVAVGDEAFVAPQAKGEIAVVHYRNVLVTIYSANYFHSTETFTAPTVKDLTDVLSAILQILK